MRLPPAAHRNWTFRNYSHQYMEIVSYLQLGLASDVNFVALIQAEQGLDSASADMNSVC